MHDTDATTITSRRDSRFDRGRVPQPLDVVVDRRVLLDVGVRLRDVRLGLVVVVVGDEVLDGVVREQLPQLVGQLGGQRLVRRHHQRRPLQLLDQPRGGRRLAGAGRAQQHDVLLARADAPLQVVDRRRLVAGGLVLADHLEPAARRGISPTGRNSESARGTSWWAAPLGAPAESALAEPGISVAKATKPGYEGPPTLSRSAG